MTGTVNCPPANQLQKLALGLIDESEIESLSGHLLACSRCTETIAGLNASDTLADALRAVPRAAGQLVRRGRSKPRFAGLPVGRNREQRKRRGYRGIGRGYGRASRGRCLARAIYGIPVGQRACPRAYSPNELGRLGPYRVLKLLDSGGMGGVFLAEDEQLQRKVALKIMKPELSVSPEARQRFLREARSAAALRHDNIVTVYHVGEDRGTPWLAMELLEGESLKSRLDRCGKLDVLETVRIGRQIAEAMAAAHSRWLIHRDIKPANIWLEGRGHGTGAGENEPPTTNHSPPHSLRVKVLDFGLARLDTDDAQLTRSGFLVGTPAYMAPEQARGELVDLRCDLFSLGCVLYRMLTGKSPFGGKDTMATLTALATHTPPSVRDVESDVPVELDKLVIRLLAKEPAEAHSNGC